jgi:hypothetical protein
MKSVPGEGLSPALGEIKRKRSVRGNTDPMDWGFAHGLGIRALQFPTYKIPRNFRKKIMRPAKEKGPGRF